MVDKIHCMVGEYRWLSNFHECLVWFDGLWYPSSEAAYQAQKTTDEGQRQAFTTMTPTEAKKAGKKVKCRDDWEDIKLDVMDKCLRSKFSKEINPDLVELLLATGKAEIEEGNWWKDSFWGIAYGSKDDCVKGINPIGGRNELGKQLMTIRWALRNTVTSDDLVKILNEELCRKQEP